MKTEYRILSTTAILGYGFPMTSFERGLAEKPDLIAADAGSTDPGPWYLGSGTSFTDRAAVKRDLAIMLRAGLELKIPIVVGTAGGSGADVHLQWCLDIAREICREDGLHPRVGVIHAEYEPAAVVAAHERGDLVPLGPAPEADRDTILASSHIVGQMGVEPFIYALDQGVDFVLAGRAYDPSVFAADPIRKGCDPGLALHLGKILECAAICADPGSGSDCMMGYLGEDYFRLKALSPERRCTEYSVAAHTLYEKSDPYHLPGPGGSLDLTDCTFEQQADGSVKVTGSRFIPADEYTIKLEGARLAGFRTVSIAGTRDPIMIREIDGTLEAVRARIADNFGGSLDYKLNFIIYGRDGVMGSLEPHPDTSGAHELGIIIEAVAPTQEDADTVCSFARSTMLHYGYPGRVATAGNLAFPFSPSDLHAGEVYEFSLYHLLRTPDPLANFAYEEVNF